MTDHKPEPEATILSVPKLFRLLDMVSEMHDEFRGAPLDDGARARVLAAVETARTESRDVLSADLLAELDRLAAPLDASATTDEVRIAATELLGWLEGVVVDLSLAVGHPPEASSG